MSEMINVDIRKLRRGWTTGAVATACVRSALRSFVEKKTVDSITISLPKITAEFKIIDNSFNDSYAIASCIKDAGDDPDITHLCKITAFIEPNTTGVKFIAGKGVGTITKCGLLLKVGESAINPKPREIIKNNLIEETGTDNWTITISIENGEELALQTWNPRLGILGGLSVLGTTGIVIPFSCSAWIHSIHSGIDVAIADGLNHLVGATGKTSEQTAIDTIGLPLQSYIDMGDFVGGMLKYLAKNPVAKITIAGGFAKMVKLSQGNRDLHSSRSQVDFKNLAQTVKTLGGSDSDVLTTKNANTALEVLTKIHNSKQGIDIVSAVANGAKSSAMAIVGGGVEIDIMIVSRDGKVLYWQGQK